LKKDLFEKLFLFCFGFLAFLFLSFNVFAKQSSDLSVKYSGISTNAYAGDVCAPGLTEDSLPICDQEGGKLSKSEIEEIIQLDASHNGEIYKTPHNERIYLYFFYSNDCPHCKQAHGFINDLKKLYPELLVLQYEVKKNKSNAEFFARVAKEHGSVPQGVPTFFVGGREFVGFNPNVTCKALTSLVKDLKDKKESASDCADIEVYIPLIGIVNVKGISLTALTVYLGLLDGLNPCAMWVLVFLLGLMVNADSRKRMLFLGSVFVLSSGFVYFMFMTAWLNIFVVIGYSTIVTIGLGIVAVLMGLVNIKEIFFFKKGISLMIPESAKPKLYKKARAIIYEEKGVLAFFGTVLLAFFVNFIELGCTIGLPAIYTRVLSVREIPSLDRYLYIAFYNLLYIVPLAVIVALFVFTMGKFKFKEGHAKILKFISGALMIILGLLLIFAPQALTF
jgi:thiol-disulfide isomerase/thioredoxin